MSDTLYPPDFLEDSVEGHFARSSRGSRTVYTAVWVLVLGSLAALPLLKVDIAVASPGIIRPATEKTEVRAGASGILERVGIAKGQRVKRGDVLAVVGAPDAASRLALLESQVAERTREMDDLRRLTAGGDPGALSVGRRRQEYAQFRAELDDARLQEQRQDGDLRRGRALHDQKLLADGEMDQLELQARQARARTVALTERYAGGWQADLATLRQETEQLRSQAEQLRSQSALFTVTAPEAGTVEEAASLAPGSFVAAGDRLAVISPTAALVAEMQVAPRDVGMLRVGMPVRMQVDAFNYLDWGSVHGRILDISDDFLLVDGRPAFRVRCAMAEGRLSLKNGVTGRLKKGMTLQGRFLVARRSLFQLLYDNVNDWLNPMQPGTAAEEAK
ncbi:MAG TPA: HlyD family efflux transporter periplasmic adaptor subunit [Longimicrobiaceae bacterium]|jgi:HlyD family secretion protein|nr:HlyD family efflux transporter periplasmic adaptor subunit [Longimicrobiaceae bacterium]